MLKPQRPYYETNCVKWIISRKNVVGNKSNDGERKKRDEIVLSISKVKRKFFAEMVSNSI